MIVFGDKVICMGKIKKYSLFLIVFLLIGIVGNPIMVNASSHDAKQAKHTHVYSKTTKKATLTKNGKITKVCDKCGYKKITTIYHLDKIVVDKSTYVYDTNKFEPKISAKDYKGSVIAAKYYTVSLVNSKSEPVTEMVDPGTYYIRLKFKTRYSGTLEKKVKITYVKYKVSFIANGATEGAMEAMTCKTGKEYTLTANKYVRAGYEFIGWNTKKDGSGKNYKDKKKIKNLTFTEGKTIKLYAQWKNQNKSHREIGDFSDSYKSNIFYAQLQNVKEGETLEDTIAAVALSQVDYHESSIDGNYSGVIDSDKDKGESNITEYGRWCGLVGGKGAWCGAFASWVMYMADVPNAKITLASPYNKDCFGGKYYEYTKATKASDIHMGDIIACSWSGGTADHVEIVYNDPAKDGVVYTVSGNSGNGKVVKRTYDLLTYNKSPFKISGYIRLTE